jgi:hypothetical protein
MKLSKETIALIKNFSQINSNLVIKPGNRLATMTTAKNIIAEATVAESFPNTFGIYDLHEFLGTLSLFNEPDLSFTDQVVTITETAASATKNSLKYYSANINLLTDVPQLKAFPTPDIEFDISAQTLQHILRVASVLKVSDFSVIGDGSTITLQVGDKTRSTANTYSSELGTTDKVFRINYKVENLRMISDSYKVSIANKKNSRFTAANQNLVYYVAIELDSTFGF